MKKRAIIAVFLAVVMLFTLSGVALADKPGNTTDGYGGNGAPSGPHYTLSIIGKDIDHAKTQLKESGHVIFVSLDGNNKIELKEGPFAVLDGNAFDDPAQFQLPDPDLDPYIVEYKGSEDTISAYSVYVRPLGKPGGSAEITTCAQLAASGWMAFLNNKMQKTVLGYAVENDPGFFGGYASVEQVALELPLGSHGKPKFENVTAELLTIVFEITVTTAAGTEIVYVRVPIFDSLIQGEYWDFNNDGLKNVQIRFYPNLGTDVSLADTELPSH
ncbi:hypothetical protein ACFLS8_04710 [Chloroflexota bacterium]